MNLEPTYFFSLSHYKHKALFADSRFVWEALTKIASYLKNYKLGDIEVAVPFGAFLENSHLISIGKGTTIEPGCYIKGPCIIGENCSIRHGAYIRGDVVVGDGCVIGHDTEIKNSVMLDGSHAAHFAYLGDTILGNKVNLGSGTKCANLKLDNTQVSIFLNGNKVSTGLRKFGAIVGDKSQFGCNSVSNPGTLVGQNVRVYPCVNFGGGIPSNSTVRNDAKVLIVPDIN